MLSPTQATWVGVRTWAAARDTGRVTASAATSTAAPRIKDRLSIRRLYRERRPMMLSTLDMKPHVICHMMVSLDGRIHPSRWTASPDGNRQDWTKVYEDVHGTLAGDAWL